MSKIQESFGKILELILNRSLFWKVGFIIGLCISVNLASVLYLYYYISKKSTALGFFSEIVIYFENIFYLILIISIVFLIIGAIAFWFLVKKPLTNIVNALNTLIYSPESVSMETLKEYRAQDEIGQLVQTVNQLLANFREINVYRHIIEHDESVEEVYERVAHILRKHSFSSFVIYEVSNSQNTMRVICKSDEDLEVNVEKLFNADKCRAKRTGKIVSSLEALNICRLYEYNGITNHCCIPIISGNKVSGIVEIHLPMVDLTIRDKKLKEKLNLIKTYLDETAPVIESKRYAEALKEQTFKDPLTNLYNRRFLESIIENLTAQIIRRGTVLGILMCDLDYFKSINDKYGHEVGDLVLKETAQLLADNVRKSDLVVRFGGEEFLILLLDIKEGEGEKIAEKLRKLIELFEFKTPKGIVRRTISIGVSEFPLDSSAIWEAIKFADIALYKAKETGRNRVVRFKREFWTYEEY